MKHCFLIIHLFRAISEKAKKTDAGTYLVPTSKCLL